MRFDMRGETPEARERLDGAVYQVHEGGSERDHHENGRQPVSHETESR